MERERYSDDDLVEREIASETQDPDEESETEIERRAGPKAMHESTGYPARERAEAVYGDTDVDPNRDDQRSAHNATPDEHL